MTEALTFIDEEKFYNEKKAQPGDIIMAVTSENIEDVCKSVAWLGKSEIAVSGHSAIIHHEQNPMYLAYYFQTSRFFSQKKRLAHGTKVIEVAPRDLGNIIIPLPPFETQQKIVTILDNFESLIRDLKSGLPAEIERRRKRYEYYRNQLLVLPGKNYCADGVG